LSVCESSRIVAIIRNKKYSFYNCQCSIIVLSVLIGIIEHEISIYNYVIMLQQNIIDGMVCRAAHYDYSYNS
jgi:hypothetical protein